MASTSSISETELNHSADNVELPLIENNEHSYLNEWVDLTVEEAIARGCKLREEVKRKRPKAHKTYDVINVNSKKSPCSGSSDKSTRQRKFTRRTTKIQQNRSCGPCKSRILHTQRTRNYSCYSQSSRSRSRVRRCPLRIAELAVPSKRYCMATWRDRAETLPILMVQRLKKYVMDETAIVQVSDAITCFQRKRKAQRSCKKKMVSEGKPKVCSAPLKNTKDMMEIRNLSAIFGHKLAKKLVLPMDITLNSGWQRVSDVVSEEISNLIKGKTRFYSDDNNLNKRIQEEISNKVAVWIATILEETSYKLLEEDLRVSKNKERRSGQKENLVTVIENHLLSCHRDAAELDEEEGPALDFIDELLNNVMNVCIISSDAESYSDSRSDAEHSSLSKEDSTTDMGNVEPEQITDQSNESKGGTIQEMVNDLINDITAQEFSDKSTILVDEGNNKTLDSGEHVNTEPILNLDSDPPIYGEELQYEDAVMNDEKSNPVENSKGGKIENTKGGTIQEILNDLINDITAQEFSDKSTTDEGNNKTKDSGEHVNTEPNLNLESDPLIDGEELQYEDAVMNDEKPNPVENSIALEGTRDDINIFNPVVNNQDDIKVSEVLVVLDGEEPLGDKNKKVKFSNLSMAARGVLIKYRENPLDHNSKSNLIPNLSWIMSFTNKPDILIAPPNEHLLSDADESWPENITTPMLRLTESVSRSVTSLGRIIESEEKVSNLQDEDNIRQQAQIVQGHVEHHVKTVEPDHHTDNAKDQRIPIDNDAVVAVDNIGDDTGRISMEKIGMSNVVVINFIKVEDSDQATYTADLKVRDTRGLTDDNTVTMDDGDLSDISCTEPIQEIKVELNKIKSKQMTENEKTTRSNKKEEIKDTKLNAAISSGGGDEVIYPSSS